MSNGPLSRREFFGTTAAGLGGAALLAACGPQAPNPGGGPAASTGAFTGGGSLKLLTRSHFIPAYDVWLDKWVADWGAKNKVDVTVDHVLAGDLPAKWAAEVSANAGHDLFGFTQSGAVNVYNKQL